MIGEQIILRYRISVDWIENIFLLTRQTQSLIAQSSVYLMLVGAMIAASDDLTFNWFGYVFLLMNNFCTAAQGVVIKQKLVNKVKFKNTFSSRENE
jgi:solute carrier family 35 protein